MCTLNSEMESSSLDRRESFRMMRYITIFTLLYFNNYSKLNFYSDWNLIAAVDLKLDVLPSYCAYVRMYYIYAASYRIVPYNLRSRR